MGGTAGGRVTGLLGTDPERLGAYRLTGRLGQGGMGTVYLARDASDRQVALKVIRADLAAEPEFRKRFRSEVDRARQVPPFCTAEVLDADPDHVTPYLVVEYVNGPDLAGAVAADGPMTAANLHALAIGVATALTAIHGAGVVHRDLKPRNVLLAPGSPKVIDFGIARATEATGGDTRPNQMLGTVAYMAPERFNTEAGRPPGPAGDVFAWGAVIAYAGTGRDPFGNDSLGLTAARILTRPPDLDGLRSPLRELVEAALAKDPAARPTARDLLERLLGIEPVRGRALAGRPDLRDAVVAATDRYAPSDAAEPERPSTGRRVRVILTYVAVFLVAFCGIPAAALRLVPGVMHIADAVDVGPTHVPSASSRGPEDLGVLSDDLVDAGLWRAVSDAAGSCSFRRKLVVRARSATYRCLPADRGLAGDQQVSVDLVLADKDSCGVLWFLLAQPRGYELIVCRDSASLVTHHDGTASEARPYPLAAPVEVGSPARLTVEITQLTCTVSIDGRAGDPVALDERVDPASGGTVTFGVAGRHGSTGSHEVFFRQFEARTVGS